MTAEPRGKKWAFLGTDYVYLRTTNNILESCLKDSGAAAGVSADDIPIIGLSVGEEGLSGLDTANQLEREVRELRPANEILKKASAYFAAAELDRPFPQMIAFIDDHRRVFGVGPVWRVPRIAPSTFYAFKAVDRDPPLASKRARQDRLDIPAIKQAFDGSRGRYGARKVWHPLRRSGHDITRLAPSST